MGQVVQTNGDYVIKTSPAGTILLDTGENVGTVRVTGNLIVTGDTLTVSADNLNVKDNIITLNFGEQGSGVTLDYSGIQVDRGTLPPASFIFDELTDTWLLTFGSAPGPFNFENSSIRLRSIKTDPGTDNGALTLIGTGNGIVNVAGTVNYEQRVLNDDDIPNKKYVDDAIINQPSFQIVTDVGPTSTRVITADQNNDVFPPDPNIAGSVAYLFDQTNFGTENNRSAVTVIVDGILSAQFYDDKLIVGQRGGIEGLEIDGKNFEIRTESLVSDRNIFIKTNGTGKLQTNYAIQLDKIAGIPASINNTTILHSRTPEIGTTGVWFVNDSSITSHRTGELVSKNRALLFSMLF
jgi:hypothetical protein